MLLPLDNSSTPAAVYCPSQILVFRCVHFTNAIPVFVRQAKGVLAVELQLATLAPHLHHPALGEPLSRALALRCCASFGLECLVDGLMCDLFQKQL